LTADSDLIGSRGLKRPSTKHPQLGISF